MAYTTVDEVKSLFRRLKIEADTGDEKTNTVVTTEEVDEFISEADAMIDARLRKCYSVVPITDTEDLKIMSAISKYIVADVIQNIAHLTTNPTNMMRNSSQSQNQELGRWKKKAVALLDSICPKYDPKTCEVCPPDMQLNTALSETLVPQGAAVSSSSTNTPEFLKGQDNW